MKRSFLLFSVSILLFFSIGFKTVDDNNIKKIYLYNNTLIKSVPLISISFYNVIDPSDPSLVRSIRIEGNHDVAIKDDIMFADNFADLVVYDISDLNNPEAIDTIKNIFDNYNFIDNPMPWTNDVVMNDNYWGCNSCYDSDPVAVPSDAYGGSGTGGSLARFAIAGNYLYCIDNFNLVIFEISQPDKPQYKNTIHIDWSIETLFSYGDNLFIGGRQGMFIYSITDPENPQFLSEFSHATACDPVVVENEFAYVTLRSGNNCGAVEDALHILDVSKLNSPGLLKSIGTDGPYGLSVKSKIVYLCDGFGGLKIFDTNNLSDIKLSAYITDIIPYDSILRDTFLYVTTLNGISIFDVSDYSNPVLLSSF